MFSPTSITLTTEWLPIWVMAIEHPEGLFVLDTGERAEVNNKNYFKSEGPLADWYCATQYKFAVHRDDEIDRQLEAKKIPLKSTWFNPTLVDLKTPFGPFKNAHYLTTQKDILLIHTPGHTHGHCSVLIRTDTIDILFAGDVCYSETDLKKDNLAANLASRRQAKKTYAAIKQYALDRPLIFLPTHDPDAAQRLRRLQTLSL